MKQRIQSVQESPCSEVFTQVQEGRRGPQLGIRVMGRGMTGGSSSQRHTNISQLEKTPSSMLRSLKPRKKPSLQRLLQL